MSARTFFMQVVVLFFPAILFAAPSTCIFKTDNGAWRSARSLEQIPPRFRSSARCDSGTLNEALAAPEDINLKGSIREEVITSNLGTVRLRWPRKLEVLFGRTPQRAVSDAILTVSKVLRSNSFPAEIQGLRQEWQIVFMDEDLPTTQIPTSLVSNCHPAWMTPPANLYVVGQRVVAGCGNSGARVAHSVADAQLAQVLIHEIGHAIEAKLLGRNMDGDRPRAEGFACWFEQFAAEYSSVIPKGSTRDFYLKLARSSIHASSGQRRSFQGTAEDYAVASLVFHSVVERRGVRSLMQVYEQMVKDTSSFNTALKKSLGWDEVRLGKEISAVLANK